MSRRSNPHAEAILLELRGAADYFERWSKIMCGPLGPRFEDQMLVARRLEDQLAREVKWMMDNSKMLDATVGLWDYMQKEYGSTVVQKATSATMHAAASFLSVLNIQSKDQFMKDFVTTLHRTIYIPFKIGEQNDRWSLWSQMRVCVHEHQHIEQGDREGWATFSLRYVTSSSFRAGFEAECYGCDMEMEFWKSPASWDLNRLIQFAEQRAEGLRSYGCTEEDIAQAKAMLLIRAGVVSQGAVENRSTKRAIEWLSRQPELILG